jgi:O-antigen/teichoic acid export membrane protein
LASFAPSDTSGRQIREDRGVEGTSDTSSGFGRGALQLAAANAAYVLAAYLTTTLVARTLGPERFSGFGVVMAWITVLTALLVKGLATSVAREMAASEGSPSAAWRAGASLGAWLSAGLAATGAAISPFVAHMLHAPELSKQLAIGALGALSFGTNAILLAWPTGLRKYGRQALGQAAYGVARLVLVLGGASVWGLNGAVVGYVLAPLVASAALIMPVPKGHDSVPTRAHWSAMLRSIVPISLVSIAITAYFVVDVFAITAALGGKHREIGVYVAYGTLGHVTFFLLQSTSIAMVPAIAAANDPLARTRAIAQILSDTAVLLAGPTLLLMAAGDAAGRIVFGDGYDAHGLVVAPLALATAVVTWMAGLIAVDVAVNRIRGGLVIAALGVAAVAVAAWLGARHGAHAASAAGWATAAASTAAAAVLTIRARLRYSQLLELRRTLIGIGIGAVAALPPLLATNSDIVRMTIAAVCGVAWLVIVLRLRLVDARATPDQITAVEGP